MQQFVVKYRMVYIAPKEGKTIDSGSGELDDLAIDGRYDDCPGAPKIPLLAQNTNDAVKEALRHWDVVCANPIDAKPVGFRILHLRPGSDGDLLAIHIGDRRLQEAKLGDRFIAEVDGDEGHFIPAEIVWIDEQTLHRSALGHVLGSKCETILLTAQDGRGRVNGTSVSLRYFGDDVPSTFDEAVAFAKANRLAMN
jgi:hypothetical protein